MASNPDFLCGVIEGFYGHPWSTKQRKCLFSIMQSMQLNTYMYAPKDDNKHRCDWRKFYTAREAKKLRSLIQAADAAGVTFIYALSPGLDIAYAREGRQLQAKLRQLRDLGCRAFALLFDDINPRLRLSDRATFKTPAEAQCAVTNAAFEHLGRPLPFLFCPTEYCASRAKPSVADSPYLATLGAQLLPQIGVLWTGPRVVSETISAESVIELASVLRRPPIIWDNLHANDYDSKRLFLGPYCGRGVELVALLGGVLTNPNCEFEANYIAMSTLAQWRRSADPGRPSCGAYDPEAALQNAVRDWLPAFHCDPGGDCSEVEVDAADRVESLSAGSDVNSGSTQDDEEEDTDSAAIKSPLSADELLTVCHLFYLPHRHGDLAVRLLDEFHWLRVFSSATADTGPDWAARAAAFQRQVSALRLARRKLDRLPNRRLALDLLPYVSDACYSLGFLSDFLRDQEAASGFGRNKLRQRQLTPLQPQSVCRGGVAVELQRLLPPEAAQSLLLHRVFVVRSCSRDLDRGALSQLAACTEPAGMSADQLLDACQQGFALEDAFGLCAFACALPCGDSPVTVDFLPRRSPLLHLAVSPSRCDLSLDAKAQPLRRLLARCLDALEGDAKDAEDEEEAASARAPATVHCLLPLRDEARLAEGLCKWLGFRQQLDCLKAAERDWQLLTRHLL